MILLWCIALLFLIITFVFSRELSGIFKIALLLLLLFFSIATFWVLETKIPVRSPDQSWYEITPWKQIVLVISTLFGMISNYLLEYFQARIDTKKSGGKRMPKFIWEKIALPFIVAILVFGYFWEQHGKEPINVRIMLISFQNGFFWQTVLEKLKG